MTYSIIQKSQLEGALRIDAEYYQPKYFRINKIINSPELNAQKLKTLIMRQVVTGSTPKSRDCKLDGTDIKFIKTDTVREGQIIFDLADNLPLLQNRKNSEPRNGDILVTIIGATFDIVGRAARVFEDDPAMNINQNIALIRPCHKLKSNYLETFLRSKFGRLQLWQQCRQTEQVNLNCREVEEIKIPVPEIRIQEEIEQMVNTSRGLIEESKKIFQQAENLFLKELGLKEFELKNNLFSIVNLSDVKNYNRIDAEYYQPKFAELIKRLKENKLNPLTEIIENVPAKFDPQLFPEKEFNYVELSNIDSTLGIINGSSKIVGNKAASRAKRLLQKNDVIVSSVEGSLDKAALVADRQVNFLASTGFFQFRSKEILSEVLLVLAKSLVFQYQLKQRCAGTILTAVPQDSIKNILIPILPKSTQQKIAELVVKSHKSHQKSKELLEEAKRKVEELIEKPCDYALGKGEK